jgi:hypothetical protein
MEPHECILKTQAIGINNIAAKQVLKIGKLTSDYHLSQTHFLPRRIHTNFVERKLYSPPE